MKLCVWMYLIAASYRDARTQSVSPKLGMFGAGVGLCGRILQHRLDLSILSDLMPGGVCLILSVATGGAIGSGDAIVLAVCGILSDWKTVMSMVAYGLVIATLWSAVLISKMQPEEIELPFVPCLLAGRIFSMLM